MALVEDLREVEEKFGALVETVQTHELRLDRVDTHLKLSALASVPRPSHKIGKHQYKSVSLSVHARWYIAIKDQAIINGVSVSRLCREIVLDWLTDKVYPLGDTPHLSLPDKRTKARNLTGDVQAWTLSFGLPPEAIYNLKIISDACFRQYRQDLYGLRGTLSTPLRTALGEWLWEHSLVALDTYPPGWRMMRAFEKEATK